MIDLLNKLSEKYYLQLGDYGFSPLAKLTAGIALEYCNMLRENKCLSEPFIFCFPEKKAAALWTSISILTNYYLVDYINVELEGVSVKKGDKIEIYGCVAEVDRISINGEIVLRFKDGVQVTIEKERRSQISLSLPHRSLNKYQKYIAGKKSAKHKRNAISKVLEPKSENQINQKNLKSKVILVSGRGQVGTFQHFLETIEIYGEKLQKVFPEGDNLIINADLKRYKKTSNSANELSEEKFIEFINKAMNNSKFEVIHEALRSLINIYNKDNRITEEFDHLFEDLINDFKDDIPQLDILRKNYPGLSEDLNENVRAVIINDISQLSDYPDTVKAFLETGIPVIVFCDRKVISLEDLSSFQKLFNELPNAYRINWNKNKLHSLIPSIQKEVHEKNELLENEDGTYYQIDVASGNKIPYTKDHFLDQALWKQALRYEAQTIQIDTYRGNPLDILMPALVNHIKSLDDFEIFQKSFYKNFYPAIYALKNSICTHYQIKKLIKRFEIDLDAVKNQFQDEIAQDFIKAKDIAFAFKVNTKSLKYSEVTFSINVPLECDKNFSIPTGLEYSKTPLSIKEKVVFTGYPFNEYSGKYLINSVCVDFVPEIEIKCWPNEASLTYNYLRRRIQGGYFFDNLPGGVNVDNFLQIKSDSDIETEINSYLLIDKLVAEDVQTEKNLELVHHIKYKGFQSSTEGKDNWKVNCDVLNFDDSSFMFLSKGSKILCLTEDLKGFLKVIKKSADQFFNGDIIFRYVKDRGAYVEISKRDSKISKSYSELEYWKNVLNELYSKNNFNSKFLEISLRKTKEFLKLEGNPTSQNIDRWLFDDEVISPDEDNLRIIYSAAGVDNIEKRLSITYQAYKIAAAHRISLSSRIKKEIFNKISKIKDFNGDFQISLDGEYIDVETRTISTVDNNGILVDYHHTRKILC